jgi:Ser/Thr protein kinase RdoA (MazF antagonist)
MTHPLFEHLRPEAQQAHLVSVAHRALPFWGLDASTHLRLMSLSENAVFSVRAPGTAGVLRVHRLGYNSLNAIRSELAWATALRQDTGLETPVPVPGLDGACLHEVFTESLQEYRPVVMFRFVGGARPDAGDRAVFARIGTMAAIMHDHGLRWARPPYFRRLCWDYDGCIGNLPNWGHWLNARGLDEAGRSVLWNTAETLKLRLHRYGYAPERFGLIHSDLRAANLLVRGDDAAVLDFDDCGTGWFMADLAASLSFIEERPGNAGRIGACLDAYSRLRAVSAEDAAMIPSFIMLRRMTLTAWIASRKDLAGPARARGRAFTLGTVRLAGKYLNEASG